MADYSSVKNFLHIKDFYNWIKDKSGNNSPATFYWFSVNFYYGQELPSFTTKSLIDDGFFNKRMSQINDLRFSIQSINLPQINFTGYNDKGSQSSEGTLDGSNMCGTYTVLGNSYLGLETKQFTMKILNTQKPIIERFIYPWMIECLNQTNENSKASFPRLDMVIKFWKPEVIRNNMESIKPEFLYYLTRNFSKKDTSI